MLMGVLVGCQQPVATAEPVVEEATVEVPVALDVNLTVEDVESLLEGRCDHRYRRARGL